MANLKVYLTLEQKKFQRGLRKADRSVAKLSAAVGQYGAIAGAAFGAAAVFSTKAAIDAEETANKFSVVFASVADDANNMTNELRKSYGLGRQESQKLLGDTGDLLTGFGFTQKAALDLSSQVQRLAVDLASFQNFEGGVKRASEALTKALLGEAEQAKALGIVIRQGSPEYKQMVADIQRANGVTLLQAKAMTALKMAAAQSKNAIGDYARTSKSAANQLKLMRARVDDLKLAFGGLVLKIFDVGKEADNTNDKLFALTSTLEGRSDEIAFTVKSGAIIIQTALKNTFDFVRVMLSNSWNLVKVFWSNFTELQVKSWKNFTRVIVWGTKKALNTFKQFGVLAVEIWATIGNSIKSLAVDMWRAITSPGTVKFADVGAHLLESTRANLEQIKQSFNDFGKGGGGPELLGFNLKDMLDPKLYEDVTATIGKNEEDKRKRLAALDLRLRIKVESDVDKFRKQLTSKRATEFNAIISAGFGAFDKAKASFGEWYKTLLENDKEKEKDKIDTTIRERPADITDQFLRIGGIGVGGGSSAKRSASIMARQLSIQESMARSLKTLVLKQTTPPEPTADTPVTEKKSVGLDVPPAVELTLPAIEVNPPAVELTPPAPIVAPAAIDAKPRESVGPDVATKGITSQIADRFLRGLDSTVDGAPSADRRVDLARKQLSVVESMAKSLKAILMKPEAQPRFA